MRGNRHGSSRAAISFIDASVSGDVRQSDTGLAAPFVSGCPSRQILGLTPKWHDKVIFGGWDVTNDADFEVRVIDSFPSPESDSIWQFTVSNRHRSTVTLELYILSVS